MKHRDTTLPLREVHVHNVRLHGLKVRAMICYTVKSKDTHTWTQQPIEFDFCDMRNLAIQFHTIAKSLTDQLAQLKTDLRGRE